MTTTEKGELIVVWFGMEKTRRGREEEKKEGRKREERKEKE